MDNQIITEIISEDLVWFTSLSSRCEETTLVAEFVGMFNTLFYVIYPDLLMGIK
jgi:hypothetical protein